MGLREVVHREFVTLLELELDFKAASVTSVYGQFYF